MARLDGLCGATTIRNLTIRIPQLFTPSRSDGLCFVLPAHERLEVVHHRAGRDVLTGGFLQDFAPVLSEAKHL